MSVVELIEILNHLKMSEYRLAKILGVSRQAIGHWVHSRRNIPETHARIIRLIASEPQIINRLTEFSSKKSVDPIY